MDEEETIDFFDLIDQQYEELVQERLINGYYKNK
jgi:hypothetical protein